MASTGRAVSEAAPGWLKLELGLYRPQLRLDGHERRTPALLREEDYDRWLEASIAEAPSFFTTLRDTVWKYSPHMTPVIAPSSWTEACARRLAEHWPQLGLVVLQGVAHQLTADPELQHLDGRRAAERWLSRANSRSWTARAR